MLKPALRT